jgi:iron complex outermembrane receptor protein
MKSTKFHILLLFCIIHNYTLQAQTPDSSMSRIFAMDIEELMNTTVTIATKSDKPLNETPSIVSVITAEEIKNMGARELEDVLQTIPGFELLKKFPGYYGVGIRGVKSPRESSKLLILIDGTPYNQLFYGISLVGGYNFNIDFIERIEVIRGPGSALYGRNAFSGVINIITKTAVSKNFSTIKLSGGTYNTKSVSASIGANRNRLKASFGINKLLTDGTNVKFKDNYGTYLWNIYHNNLMLNTNISYNNITFSGMFNILEEGGTLYNSFREAKAGYYTLSYSKSINPKFSIKSKIYSHFIDNTENIEYLKPDAIPNSYPLGIYITPHFNEYICGTENELHYKTTFNNDILVGILAETYGIKNANIKANVSSFNPFLPISNVGKNNQINYEPGWFENEKHNYYNLAFYLQDIWYPFQKTGVTIGLRYDIESEIGSVINPRIGLFYEPVNKLTFKLLYGKAYRAPSPAEQYKTLGYVKGNKDLKPEIINTLEFSLNYNYKYVSNSLCIFYNNLKDVISAPMTSSINPFSKYYNIGKNMSKGIEYEAKFILGKKINSYFNYSYTISENTDTINGISTTRDHEDIAFQKINAGINCSFLNHFNINLNGFYRGKMKKFTVYYKSISLGEVQDPIGDFLIINSSIHITEPVKHVNISLSVFNVFNKKYYSQDSERLKQPNQPGRQLIMSISYSF